MSLPTELLVPKTAVPDGLIFRLVEMDDERPLHQLCFSQQTSKTFSSYFQNLLQRQSQKHLFWIIIEKDRTIIGNGQLIFLAQAAECANLFVTEPYRNLGIGTALIEVLTAVAQHHHIATLEIGVETENQAALRLYQRLGFIVQKELIIPENKPALILRKNLPC